MKLTLSILLLLGLCSPLQAVDKRSRAEAIPGIISSNTVGIGNIWLDGFFESFVQTSVQRASSLDSSRKDIVNEEWKFLPSINGEIGLTQFMDLSLQNIPWDGNKMGVTEAHLKLTFPNNRTLRVLGFAVMANATLSTEENIISVQKETPTFDPIVWYMGIIDFDLIKLMPSFPLKIYLNYSSLNDYRFYRIYSQYSFDAGAELKQEHYSLFVKGGFSLYREKESQLNRESSLSLIDMGVGFKWRFVNLFPLNIGANVELDPIEPMGFLENDLKQPLKIKIFFEYPLYYKKTKSETIRTLIFDEKKRKNKKRTNSNRTSEGREHGKQKNLLSLKELELANESWENENIQKLILKNKQLESIKYRKRKKIYNKLIYGKKTKK